MMLEVNSTPFYEPKLQNWKEFGLREEESREFLYICMMSLLLWLTITLQEGVTFGNFDKSCEKLIMRKALCFSRLESLETRLEHFSKALDNFLKGLERLETRLEP